jgi:hypothetical protein
MCSGGHVAAWNESSHFVSSTPHRSLEQSGEYEQANNFFCTGKKSKSTGSLA